MIKKTYNNVLKTIKMIEAKGYTRDESTEIALAKWDEYEQMDSSKVGHIDRFIDMIISKEEFLKFSN